MIFPKLSLPVFILFFDQIFCSFTFHCEINKKTAKDKYLEESKIFKSKVEQIFNCGHHFKKEEVAQAKRQAKFKKCIKKCKIPKDFESGLLELTSADFETIQSFFIAIERVGVAYCNHNKSHYSNLTPDMEMEKLTIQGVLNDRIQEEIEDGEGGVDQDDENDIEFDGHFGSDNKNKKKKTGEDEEDKKSKTLEVEENSSEISSDPNSSFINYTIICGIILIIIIIIAKINQHNMDTNIISKIEK